jgi:hypothetical protein
VELKDKIKHKFNQIRQENEKVAEVSIFCYMFVSMMNLIAAFFMNRNDYTLAITDHIYLLPYINTNTHSIYSNNVYFSFRAITLPLKRNWRTKNMHQYMI